MLSSGEVHSTTIAAWGHLVLLGDADGNLNKWDTTTSVHPLPFFEWGTCCCELCCAVLGVVTWCCVVQVCGGLDCMVMLCSPLLWCSRGTLWCMCCAVLCCDSVVMCCNVL